MFLRASRDWSTCPPSLAPSLRSVLAQRGIQQLYSHQAEAFRLAETGRNVTVVTPTASGKTLCYNLPVLQRIAMNPDARALYLYPTKALTYDQLDDLMSWANALERDFGVYSYDGDTPQDARSAVRAKGHIVLTNPDMLHKGILPHHTKWARLFENLSFIVVDELHTYRGVFGSHVANVFRRLARVCEFYGSRPQFICTSATIANPKELAEHLTGAPFELIGESGAGAAEKHVFFYNPPVVNQQLGIRRSYVNETKQIAAAFLKRNIPAIVFANSRLITEILVRYLKAAVETGPAPQETVVGYRGGYLPNERRQIERGLRDGRIRGVVSTNALELGHRYRQPRCGRACRLSRNDRFDLATHGTCRTPQRNVGRRDGGVEHAARSVHRQSSGVLPESAARARAGESRQHPYPDQPPAVRDVRVAVRRRRNIRRSCHRRDSRVPCRARIHSSRGQQMALDQRSVSGGLGIAAQHQFRQLRGRRNDRGKRTGEAHRILGEVDYTSAFTTLHEKAIYLHQGQQYYVHQLDIKERRAYVKQVDSDYFTDAITYTKVKTLETMETTAEHNHGEVHVAHQVVGFKKIKFFTMENVGSGDLNLPVQEMHTTAYWITIPRPQFEALPFASIDRLNGLHGLAYALAQLSAVFLMCDRRDLGSAVEFGLENPDVPSDDLHLRQLSGRHWSEPSALRDSRAGAGCCRSTHPVLWMRRRMSVVRRSDAAREGSGARDSGYFETCLIFQKLFGSCGRGESPQRRLFQSESPVSSLGQATRLYEVPLADGRLTDSVSRWHRRRSLHLAVIS